MGDLWFPNRSLVIVVPVINPAKACKSLLKILDLLEHKGFLKNNCELQFAEEQMTMIMPFERPLGLRFLEVIRSMHNLEKLDIMEYDVTFSELAHLFQSCPKIIHLHLRLARQDTWDSEEDLSRNQLKLGFQKLQLFKMAGYILHSGNLFLEILPYVKYYNFKERRY